MIHDKSLELLEGLGVKVLHEGMTKMLVGAGGIRGQNNTVKIPPELVERALETAPQTIRMYDRNGEPAMVLDGTETHYGAASDTLYYRDHKTGLIRPTTVEDLRKAIMVTEAMSNMHHILAGGILKIKGQDPKKVIVFVFKKILRYTTKPVGFMSYDLETHQQILEIAFRVAGGKTAFQKKPFVFHYSEPIPPLTFPQDGVDKLIVCAQKRVPLIFMPYCMMGGTAPITSAGAILQCNTEVLASLVMQQIVHEGAPYIYGAMPTMMDMRTTVGSYGSPELHQNIAAMTEIARFYGLPFYGTAAVTDSKNLDAQAYSETMMSLLFTALSKPDMAHNIGLLYHSNVLCIELVVVANEIIDMLRSITSGIDVNEETLSVDVIKRVGPQGHYLMEDQTCGRFREKYYPDLFDRSIEGDPPPAEEKVRQRIDAILEAYKAPPIDEKLLEG
jgi:trimethylamine--corrinoid protein Co-methyltransferase